MPIQSITIHESEYRRIEVSELLEAIKSRGVSQSQFVRRMKWSWGFFSTLKKKRYAELPKDDVTALLKLLHEASVIAQGSRTMVNGGPGPGP